MQDFSNLILPPFGKPKRRIAQELRKFGGEWKAIRLGFAYYRYEGELDGHHYEIMSHAYLAPRYDGDDSTWLSLWTVTCDGDHVGTPVRDPVALLRQHLGS